MDFRFDLPHVLCNTLQFGAIHIVFVELTSTVKSELAIEFPAIFGQKQGGFQIWSGRHFRFNFRQ